MKTNSTRDSTGVGGGIRFKRQANTRSEVELIVHSRVLLDVLERTTVTRIVAEFLYEADLWLWFRAYRAFGTKKLCEIEFFFCTRGLNFQLSEIVRWKTTRVCPLNVKCTQFSGDTPAAATNFYTSRFLVYGWWCTDITAKTLTVIFFHFD